MKLLIAAGGTGGHIFPGVSVAEAFVAEKGNEVVFTGTSKGLEDKLIPASGFRLVKIEAAQFSGQRPAAKLAALATLAQGLLRARTVIRQEKPEAILGMGGFTTVSVMLAGLSLHVPCFIHEQNVYPGLANRLLSRWVRTVFVSFQASTRHIRAGKTDYTGNPIRRAVRGKRVEKEGHDFNIFVFGGSRGARSINDAVLGLLPYLEAFRNTALYHQTGDLDFERVKAAYKGSGTRHEVFPFTGEMDKYYNLADVVISRAGASTIFELAYFKKAAVLVPYPFAAGNHQWQNASLVEEMGGCHVIGNDELTAQELYRVITELRESPEETARMAESMGSIYVEGSEEKIMRGIKAGVS